MKIKFTFNIKKNAMKVKCFFSAFVVLLFFVNCSEDNSIEHEVEKEVKVTATFKGIASDRNASTRVANNMWEDGDAIGLFMLSSGGTLDHNALASNVKYVSNGTVLFTNPSDNKTFYPFNSENVDFIAYYPYQESINNFMYEIDVSIQDKLSDIDLLYSNDIKSVNSSLDVVDFKLKHQLVKVVVNLKPVDKGLQLNNFDVKISNVNTNASFSFKNGEIINKSNIGDVSFNIDLANKRAEAVLIPEDDLTNININIMVDGTSYAFPLKNSTTENCFNQSQQYTYSIQLKEGVGPVLDGVTATIEDWINNEIDGIYADEVPKDDGNSDNTDDEVDNGGDNQGGSDEGATTNPGEDAGNEGGDQGDVDTPDTGEGEHMGDGSQNNPYTIDQIIDMAKGYDVSDAEGTVYLENVWVKGYIVGSYNTPFKSHEDDYDHHSLINVALSFLSQVVKDDVDLENKLFPVCFENMSEYFKKLSLNQSNNHKVNFGREVIINGDVGNGQLVYNGKYNPAIINLKEVIIDGK